MARISRISFQRLKIVDWYSSHSGTMLECSKATGIERANICRLLWNLREDGIVVCVGYRRDFFTGEMAMVFTLKEGSGK